MKKTIKFFAIAVITLSSITLASCDKDDPDPVIPTPNIVEKAQADTNFSILVTAVVKTGLTTALSTTPNLTVFAPLNNAFRKLGITSASINALTAQADIDNLKAILQYHVIGQKYESGTIPTAANTELTALSNVKTYVSKNANGVFVNGVKVAIADVGASNGVIHAVDRVIIPPAGNFVTTLSSNADYSLLVAAVTNCDSANILVGALTGAGPLTVMAPKNQGFIDIGFTTAASFSGASAATKTLVRKYILHHVIPARVFSGDLTNNQSAPTVLGQNITFTLTGGAKVKGAAGASPTADIETLDWTTSNGVIHGINKVILPN
jgi:uncharacterized surface protein with fasciclin (FAS1) repeats